MSIFYFLIICYSALMLLTEINIKTFEDKKTISILYPFSENPFFNLENHQSYLVLGFILPLFLYAFFFFIASNVFKIFTLDKLFTQKNITSLKIFYLINLFLPFPITFVCSFFIDPPSGIWMLSLVHLILGVFIYFFTEIFAQGVGLQNEQDLYI